MAKVTIGGNDYIVPELNFIALEKAWKSIRAILVSDNPDPLLIASAGIEVIAYGLIEAPDFDRSKFGIEPDEVLTSDELDSRVVHSIKKQLKAGEIQGVHTAMDEIKEEAGLLPEQGEPLTQELSPGTETLNGSSQNLSQQDVREEAGTA